MSPESAIYCWNPATGEADMLCWPQDQHRLGDYECTIGATERGFQRMFPYEQIALLACEACRSVLEDGIDQDVAMAALSKVDRVVNVSATACDCYAIAMRSRAVAGKGKTDPAAPKAGGFYPCKGV